MIASGIGLPEDVLNAEDAYMNALYAHVLMSLTDSNQIAIVFASEYGMRVCLKVLQGWQGIYVLLKTREHELNSGIPIN